MAYSHTDPRKRAVWDCICSCGRLHTTEGSNLRRGKTRSCGCLAKESQSLVAKSRATHAMSGTQAYHIWHAMILRCSKPTHPKYKNYGGRGITVSERWKSFALFHEDMGEKPERMSLDRIDNNLGYSKENCRWATYEEQSRNKRTNRWIEFNGDRLILSDWAKKLNVSVQNLQRRLNDWPLEKALTTNG